MIALIPLLLVASPVQDLDGILTVDDASAFSSYGESVAVAGDWAFVGAPDDFLSGSNYVGSVYAFERTATGWVERQKLIASDGALFHTFGHAIAADGDRVVIGAPDPLGSTAGAAYVFQYDGLTWVEEQKLLPSTGGGDAWFGWSVDIQGDRVAVGAMWAGQSGSGTGTHAGAAWVFHHDGASWVVEQELVASDYDSYDLFGASISLDGTTIAVGARGEGDRAGGGVVIGYIGAVYLYDLSGGTWIETQKLRASDFGEHAWFGEAVALDGDWLFVGSPGKSGGGTFGLGVAYIFSRAGGVWTELDKIESAKPGFTRTFGNDIALQDGLAVIASGGDDFLGHDQGAVHPFRLEGGAWVPEPAINPGDLGPWDLFAQDVDLDAGRMITGAYVEGMPPPDYPGAGYVYDVTPQYHLMVQPLPLDVIEDAKFEVRFGMPNAWTWLVYSLAGPGSTPIPPLGIILDLANPQLLAPAQRTDGTGFVKWEMPIPPSAQGVTVWFQSAQFGQVTNLIMTTIQ